MDIDANLLRNLLERRRKEINAIVAGTGYLPRTVIGVGTFLLDNDCEFGLLTAKQKVTFQKFLAPLLIRYASKTT